MIDDIWFWINDNGKIEIYCINTSKYEPTSYFISFDHSFYHCVYSKEFNELKRKIDIVNNNEFMKQTKIICVAEPQKNIENMDNNDINDENKDDKNTETIFDKMRYYHLCTLKRIDKIKVTIDIFDKGNIPELLIYRDIDALSIHNDNYKYLLPYAIDHDYDDLLIGNNNNLNSDIIINKSNKDGFLCSQEPGGTFSHACGAYYYSYDFACPIGMYIYVYV